MFLIFFFFIISKDFKANLKKNEFKNLKKNLKNK